MHRQRRNNVEKFSAKTTSFNCSNKAAFGIISGITTVVEVVCSNAPNPLASFSPLSDKYKRTLYFFVALTGPKNFFLRLHHGFHSRSNIARFISAVWRIDTD